MRMQDYHAGRNDGLLLALRIIKEDGMEALEKECKFRKMTNINTGVPLKEINKASLEINHLINESQILLCLSVLHDEFDFGKTRLNQAMDAWEEKNAAFRDDLFLYADYREQIGAVMKKILKTPTLDQQMRDKAKEKGVPYRDPVKPEKKQKKMSRKARMKFRESERRKSHGASL